MNGLVEFLMREIAADEAVARETPGDHAWECDPHPARPVIAQVVSSDGALASDVLTPDARHIARWDPARVLAECEAKRRIVAEWQGAQAEAVAGDLSGRIAAFALYLAMKALALPYADRPGFREEWRA